MTLVGFKRARIGIQQEDGSFVERVIEGRAEEGATTTAEISGLAPTPTRVYGSDVAYYVSNRGTGDVTVNLGLLDLPEDVSDEVLGYKKVDGISFHGRDTEAPYTSLVLESEDLQGNTAIVAFFKGKISKESIAMNTLGEGDFTPEAETYVFTAIEDDKEGNSQGQVLGKYIGNEQESIDALRELAIPTSTPSSTP